MRRQVFPEGPAFLLAKTQLAALRSFLGSALVSADDLPQGKTDVLVQSRNRTTALDQIDVHVAGIGRFHDPGRRPFTTDEQASLIDSWAGFIQQSGGRLHVEQPLDTGPADNTAPSNGSG